MRDHPRIALITYSTRPRGGPVHTVELAEALHDLGCPVHVFAIGDPGAGFYRALGAPHTIFPGPEPRGTLEERFTGLADPSSEPSRDANRDRVPDEPPSRSLSSGYLVESITS